MKSPFILSLLTLSITFGCIDPSKSYDEDEDEEDEEDENGCGQSNATAFTLSIWNVTTTEDLNGDSWDYPGGLPDPSVCIYIDDNEIGCSITYSDTTSPNINYTADIAPNSYVDIVFFDEDVSDWEYMDGLRLTIVDLQELANCGTSSLNGNEVDFSFEIEAD